MFTSDYLNERSMRKPQEERYTSPKRIDLRKVAFGDAKLKPFARFQKRRASSAYEQSLPQPSQPSIHDSGWLFHFEGSLVLSFAGSN
jgi:hypothetical protein